MSMQEEYGQSQSQSEQGKSGKGQGQSGKGEKSGGGGGNGDKIKGALQALVSYADNLGSSVLDPYLADLLASAKRILSEQEE